MAELTLPVLSHFQNGNPWSASDRRMRYRVLPALAEETLTAQVWEGPWAYEFSVVEEKKVFPLSQEGLDALPEWLEAWSAQINARPERTFAENVARRTPLEPDREPVPPGETK